MEAQRWPPLHADDPLVGDICPVCQRPFRTGDVVTLVDTGPETDDDRRRLEAGMSYTALNVPAHWNCVVGES